jgi:Flavin-binding monooxygenase-like
LIEIDGRLLAESGAIVEYIVHVKVGGRLQPSPGDTAYAGWTIFPFKPKGVFTGMSWLPTQHPRLAEAHWRASGRPACDGCRRPGHGADTVMVHAAVSARFASLPRAWVSIGDRLRHLFHPQPRRPELVFERSDRKDMPSRHETDPQHVESRGPQHGVVAAEPCRQGHDYPLVHEIAAELPRCRIGGRQHHHRGRVGFAIVAGRILHKAKLPGIPGVESFKGKHFHTSRWDYDYIGGSPTKRMDKLADKRVALIGTGATSVQVVPRLAETARQLFVCQRTPSAVGVRGNRPTDPEWADALKPGWQDERMENFTRIVSGQPAERDLIEDAGPRFSGAIQTPSGSRPKRNRASTWRR